MSSSSKRQVLGLFVLVEPSTEIAVDVVAVHGMNGDYIKTWTHSETGNMWLRDLLPIDLPSARVMSFGWDSQLSSSDYVSSYREWGIQLASMLASRRQSSQTQKSPMVIIAHSLGGIIVKHMIAYAQRSPDEDIASIPPSVAAVLFFGTPHRGNDVVANSLRVLRIASRLPIGPNKRLLSELQDTDSLERLSYDFIHFLNTSSCRVYSFYEMKMTGGIGSIVVTKDSTFLGHPKERLSGVASNHSSLVKYESREHGAYHEVVAAISRSINNWAVANEPGPVGLGHTEIQVGRLQQTSRLRGDGRAFILPSGSSSLKPSHLSQRAHYALQGQLSVLERGTLSIRREPTARFVFDALSESEAAETGSAFAEEWFDDLRDKVHQAVEERRKDSDPRVKVAILDSGVDQTHPLLKGFFERGQITTKSFIEGEPGTSDVCGHGTHMTDLVLRVAPSAHVFVAKVFLSGQSTEMELNQDLIAKAIHYATHTEKVDVISMSWGYQKEIPAIRDAIRDAFHHHTILIAAASNTGSLSKESVAFPANLRQVICINSTDGYLNPSEFNPAPSPDRTFAVIGEGLSVACPLKIGNTVRVIRGTSAATAIASGLAAMVLQYSRQKANRGKTVKDSSRLSHCDVMRKVFYGMAKERLGYHVLVPATIFHETDEERHYRISQRISAILDAL